MQKYQVTDFWLVMPFLIAFFVLYSTLVFLFCLVNRVKSTLLDLLGLMINAGIFFAIGYVLVNEAYGQIRVAIISLGLATFYVLHIYHFLRNRLLDREMLLGFTGLATFFVTVSLPLILSEQWITVSWSIQALVMLWIAAKVHSEFLRQVAYGLDGFVLFRLCILDLPDQYARRDGLRGSAFHRVLAALAGTSGHFRRTHLVHRLGPALYPHTSTGVSAGRSKQRCRSLDPGKSGRRNLVIGCGSDVVCILATGT